jgi:hypothetical protein
MSEHIRTTPVPVDELWLADWAAEGIAAFERYLARHAAFAAYLEGPGRELPDGNGDEAR